MFIRTPPDSRGLGKREHGPGSGSGRGESIPGRSNNGGIKRGECLSVPLRSRAFLSGRPQAGRLLLAMGGAGMRAWGMASSPDVVEYICFQLRHAGDISFKKMFGEYGLYCDRKFFGLVCDNQLFVKMTEPGLSMLPEQEQGSPYPGARPHFLMTELDDDQALSSLVRETCSVLDAPDVLSGKKKASGEKRSRRP